MNNEVVTAERFRYDGDTVRLFRHLCFGEPSGMTTGEEISCFHRAGFPEYAYFFHLDRLPEELKQPDAAAFMAAARYNLMQNMQLESVIKMLVADGIPCCPFKGADLSLRCYPHPALRFRSDIDLLVPPEKTGQAVDLLHRNGWISSGFKNAEQHERPLQRCGVALEIHEKPSNINNFDFDRHTEPVSPEQPLLRHLGAEFYTVLLFQHSMRHNWSNGFRMLLDLGFLLANERGTGLDWKKTDELAEAMNMPFPELLFLAFDDFFPAVLQPAHCAGKYTAEEKDGLRRLILLSPSITGFSCENKLSSEDKFSWKWWKFRIKFLFDPASARYWAKDRKCSPVRAYWLMWSGKVRSCLHYLFGKRDRQVTELLTEIRSMEKVLRR